MRWAKGTNCGYWLTNQAVLVAASDPQQLQFFLSGYRAAALLDLQNLRGCLDRAYQKIRTEKIKGNDVKETARLLKVIPP